MTLRVLLLTWEYPPRIVGDVAFAVRDLSEGLRRLGVETIVITLADSPVGLGVEEKEGLKVIRVGNPVGTHVSILTWDMTLMTEFERVSADVYYSLDGRIDLVDAHEWLCVTAALNLKNSLNLPFVFTVHSTEDQRSRGARMPLNQAIRSIEALGLREASKVIVRKHEKGLHLNADYGVPPDRIEVIEALKAEEVLKVYVSAAKGRKMPGG